MKIRANRKQIAINNIKLLGYNLNGYYPSLLYHYDLLVAQNTSYFWLGNPDSDIPVVQLSAENETSNLILILIEQENVTEENEEKRECII